MRILLGVVLALFVFTGCAAIKQGISDYNTGKGTPLAEGELSPEAQAKAITLPLSGLPVVGGFAPTIAIGLTGLFTYLRGRRIRKSNGVSTVPATGFLGSTVGAEAVIQGVSNIIAGAFEVGPDNSPLKRAWKVFLSTAISGVSIALTVPSVKDFIIANPGIALGVSGMAAFMAGLEKQVSIIKPVTGDSGKVGV